MPPLIAIHKRDLKRLKEGRGQGTGSTYKPWLTVQDLPATHGQRNRDLGITTGRRHEFLSKLERDYFLTIDFPSCVVDIREQFPLLPIERTLAIADECGVKHPRHPTTKEPIVMTTDFVITVALPTGKAIYARPVKYEKELSEKRKIEKLEICRRFWLNKAKDWKIVTENQVDRILVYNIDYVHKVQPISELHPLTEHMVNVIGQELTVLVKERDRPLNEIAVACDDQLGLKTGSSLLVARHLIASRQWRVDMTKKKIQPFERINILGFALNNPEVLMTGTR